MLCWLSITKSVCFLPCVEEGEKYEFSWVYFELHSENELHSLRELRLSHWLSYDEEN